MCKHDKLFDLLSPCEGTGLSLLGLTRTVKQFRLSRWLRIPSALVVCFLFLALPQVRSEVTLTGLLMDDFKVNAGTGWDGNWVSGSAYTHVNSGTSSLSYAEGGYNVSQTNGSGIFYADYSDYRGGARSAATPLTNVVWFSALMRLTNAMSQAYLGFNTINTGGTPLYAYYPSSQYSIGISNTTLVVGYGNNAVAFANFYATTNSGLALGTTHLILGRVTLLNNGAADRLEVWADPPDLAHLGDPQWQQTGLDVGSNLFNVTIGARKGGVVDVLRFSNGDGNPNQGFSDVTGVLNLSLSPVLLVTPQPQTVADGGNATFAVTASGTGLTYQWFRNGAATIPCAVSTTNSTLSLTNVSTACRGGYSVQISNEHGSIWSVPVALRVISQQVALTAVNYTENMPVYANAIPIDALNLWAEMGVTNGTPLWIHTLTGNANLPISLGTNGGRQVIWVYTSQSPATKLHWVAEPAEEWPATTNIFLASTDPLGTNAVLRNGVIQMTFKPTGWKLGFSPAAQTNESLMIQSGSVNFWLDYINRGRVLSGDPVAMGMLSQTNSSIPAFTASFSADGNPILTRSRQMTGFASGVTFIEDFELVSGMPLLISRVRWQNSGEFPVWLAYVGNGGGITGTWVTNLLSPTLVAREDDPFSGTVGGTAIRTGWLGSIARVTMESLTSGCGVGLSTILHNMVGAGSMIWGCGSNGFICNFIDPVVGQFPFMVDAGTTYTNGNAFLLTQTETGCFRQTTNVWATLRAGQLPVLQSPCAVFMNGTSLLPQTVSALRNTNVVALLEPALNGVLQAALRMEFTNHYACKVSAQMAASGDSILIQARKLGTDGGLYTLLQTDQTGDYVIDLNQVLGWTTDTQFILETSLTGDAALTALSIEEFPPAKPLLESPLPNQSVTDIAVSYRWAAMQPLAVDYDLQISGLSDFSTNQQIRVTSADLSPTWQPADTDLPAAGVWYWRVRAVKGSNTGEWSEAHSFTVNTSHSLAPLNRPITPQNPLFTIECTGVTQFTNFNPGLPGDVRPYCALLLEGLTGVITNAMQGVNQLPYPIIIRKDQRDLANRVNLPDLEWIFQNVTNVVGIQGGEQMDSFYSSDPYTRRLVMLCAKYGMWYHEADGIYTTDKWYSLMQQQGAFMTNYGPYLILSQKNNICIAQHYSQSASFGLWLSGLTQMHGAWNDNEFYWNAVGFGALNTSYGERSGLYGHMPDNFWNLCFVMGLSRGCALFNVDGQPFEIWNSSAWQRYMVPLVRAVINHSLVPTKTQVMQNTKLAVYADTNNRSLNTSNYPYYGAYGPLFNATYGFETMTNPITAGGELWEYFPNTGRYGYIPVLPQGNVTWPNGVNITNLALTQLQTTHAVSQAFNTAYPTNWYNGDALVSLVGDTLTVLNSWENMDHQQRYDVPLNHGLFQRINGTIEVYSYLIGKREGTEGDESLWLQMDAELTNRPAVVSVVCSRQPDCQITPTNALISLQWTNNSLNLNLSQTCGAVQVTLRATHGLTVNNGTSGGDYTNGAVVVVNADSPLPGYIFNRWIVDSGVAAIANVNAASTTVTMASGSTVITASYTVIPPGLSVALINSRPQLTISGASNLTYQVQAATNLMNVTNWITLYSNQPAALPFVWSDSGATNFGQRFYRVLLEP